MENTESKTPELKPPYGNVAWYKSFFDLIQRRSFEKFDKGIIELNIIKGPNATMLFNGLRFLDLVEDDGKVTKRFESLRRLGDEFKQNLKKVVEEAYNHLFSNVVVEKAKPENLLNYFSEHYKYSKITATLTTKIFIYLCQEAEIPLSQELVATGFKPERVEKPKKTPELKAEKREAKGRDALIVPEEMHRIEWGDRILMYLRKGDRSTRESIAKNAKKLIDMYVEEEEERTE